MISIDGRVGVPDFQGTKTDKTTLPAPETLTGTIAGADTTTTTITGTGTLFKSQLQVGQYIYANDKIRRIKEIISDTKLKLDTTFGVAFSGVTLKMTRPEKYRYIYLKATGGPIHINNNLLPIGEVFEQRCDHGLAPICYDATGSGDVLISTME
jgi:hypothetical protein